MAAVQSRAVELGCATVDFELARGNDIARAFYERLGAGTSDEIQPLRLSVRPREAFKKARLRTPQ
jgi:hypothetical protein